MKELTIKEKVRIACKQDREVVVTGTSDVHYRGYITNRNEDGFTLNRKTGTCPFVYRSITDIQFVDEGEEAGGWDERIKSLEEEIGSLQVDLENAKLQQSVSSPPEPERWEFETMQNGDRCIVILPSEDRKHGIILAKLTNDVTDQQGAVIAASLQMWDALRMVRERADTTPGKLVQIMMAHIAWKKVLDALEKAGG